MKIKRLIDVKFANGPSKNIAAIVSGWALYEEGKGYAAFSHDRGKYGILIPYMPCKKALQKILDDGGFCGFEGMEYVNPV